MRRKFEFSKDQKIKSTLPIAKTKLRIGEKHHQKLKMKYLKRKDSNKMLTTLKFLKEKSVAFTLCFEKEKMFAEWLKKELKNLGIDISVYHSYLIGILEDNIDDDEKRETINDIVSSLVV